MAPSDRTRVKRLPDRGVYDRAVIDAILDDGLVAHVGVVVDGSPRVIPTLHGRIGDTLYVHGSVASGMLRAAPTGEICVTVTCVDGLVLARSAFHHSINYRSVVVYGHARAVDDRDEKLAALQALSEHVLPGRWDEVRAPSDLELRQTTVLAVGLDEASAKVRTGPPIDDEEDLGLPVWAGVLPLEVVAREPETDPLVRSDLPVPGSVRARRARA